MAGRSRPNATLAGAMPLIAGAGLSLACWRYILSMPIWAGFPDSLQWYYFHALRPVAFLSPLSMTLLVIAWRRPHRRRNRLVSGPAVVVGLSTFLVTVVDAGLLLAIMALIGFDFETFTHGRVLYFCRLIAEQTGMAIGSACLIQALGGRCRRPKSWIDAAG